MRTAVARLVDAGCKIINMSLGSRDEIYSDGKVSLWAATLDELSREFDVLFVVSAGNAGPATNGTADAAVKDYPGYMLEDRYRIVEPATACNVVTVGAIANTNGLPSDSSDFVNTQPITEVDEPSPLSRVGPGVRGTVKPDFVDYGGTLVFEGGQVKSAIECPTAGVPTLRANYLDGLFTSASGTSYSAPLVTFKAALLHREFPGASANLLRALLVTASDIPQASIDKLSTMEKNAGRRVSGFGLPNVDNALASENGRVICYDEDELPIDEFAIYEVPMIEEFRATPGLRHIRVSLAYDPPVRHTRNDYLGIRMNFRLVRGLSLVEVKDHFRKRKKSVEGRHEDLASRQVVSLLPGPALRDVGTLQSGIYKTRVTMKDYGDTYFLVVRCEHVWAPPEIASQKYAVTIEMQHAGGIALHQKLRQRLQVRV